MWGSDGSEESPCNHSLEGHTDTPPHPDPECVTFNHQTDACSKCRSLLRSLLPLVTTLPVLTGIPHLFSSFFPACFHFFHFSLWPLPYFCPVKPSNSGSASTAVAVQLCFPSPGCARCPVQTSRSDLGVTNAAAPELAGGLSSAGTGAEGGKARALKRVSQSPASV